METEKYCEHLEHLDRIIAIRAIHQAYLQLRAMGESVEVNSTTYDNRKILIDLKNCLKSAGHMGFN